MKLIYIHLSILFLGCYSLCAQETEEFKTIFKEKDNGGYGSLSIGYAMIDSSQSLEFGARGGIILGNFFAMGIGGHGFVTEYKDSPMLNKKASLSGGYGGVFIEFIALGRSRVHLSVPVLAGIGGINYNTWENEGQEYKKINYIEDIATYLVVEPGIELEFNITGYFRLAAYVNYRYTSDIKLNTTNIVGSSIPLVDPGILNTYSAGLIFKFGKF